jgi:hypothetical protein
MNEDGSVEIENKLLNEYPFSQYVTQSDSDINQERTVPSEMQEDIDIKSERLNAYHEKQNI